MRQVEGVWGHAPFALKNSPFAGQISAWGDAQNFATFGQLGCFWASVKRFIDAKNAFLARFGGPKWRL
jgi:hypothetical protein